MQPEANNAWGSLMCVLKWVVVVIFGKAADSGCDKLSQVPIDLDAWHMLMANVPTVMSL